VTAQISDIVCYLGKRRRLAGINGFGLFNPAQHGIRTVGWCTACYRGYHCTYEVKDRSLFLAKVNLGLGPDAADAVGKLKGPKLFGKVPKRYTKHGCSEDPRTGKSITSWESSDFEVTGLHEMVSFTGGLLLGDDFIEEMYVHMGFHPAYKFRTVHELEFDAGRLVEEHDRSRQVAEFRQTLSPDSLEPPAGAPRAELEEWIDRCFSLEYPPF
jgi:hypothetical protein